MPVGQRHRLRLVVRDVEDREAEPPLQVLDLEAHLLAEVRIERRQRLVEQHDVRTDRERAGERHALLAAARQVVGAALCRGERGWCAAAPPRCARSISALRQLAHAQRERDVLEHREVRPDGEGLEHHAEVALLRRQVEVLAAATTAACRRRGSRPRPGPRSRRPSAAWSSCRSRRAPASRRTRPRAIVEVEAVDRGDRAEALAVTCGDEFAITVPADAAALPGPSSSPCARSA